MLKIWEEDLQRCFVDKNFNDKGMKHKEGRKFYEIFTKWLRKIFNYGILIIFSKNNIIYIYNNSISLYVTYVLLRSP